jgi:cell division protein FtsN
MSTKVGTLQAPRASNSILLAVFLGSLVMLTIAVVVISFANDQGRQGETTCVGRHVVNTPSEQSAGIVSGAEQTFVGGTAANTPSELNAQARVELAQARVDLGIKAQQGEIGANTPSELNQPSWSSPPASRHKVMSDTPGTNTPAELSGGIIGGLPAEFYDRHQRG